MEAKDSEFQDFYKKYYVPNNAVLIVAGDINKTETKKWVSTYFSTIPKGTTAIQRSTIVEPPLTVITSYSIHYTKLYDLFGCAS